ncbi:hypothetical protein E1285_02165 [Actinomadura sp. 7K507]|nr:hypothetical protein E1285_02165 [Actinomadura sp. 7K507]
MCQRSLVIDAGAGGDEYNIAEAAHIVAESPAGPRGAAGRPADIDGIDNLVLLCPSDHRTIDKGAGDWLWPSEKLRRLKRDHESWTVVMDQRPPLQAQSRGKRKRTPPGPGDVVLVDDEPYRLCGEAGRAPDVAGHVEGAYETVLHDDGSTWCQGHAYGEGSTEGHAWVRRLEASPGTGELRAMLAKEIELLVEVPVLPGMPRLLGVEMTAEAITLVTEIRSPVSVRGRLTRTRPIPGRDELILLVDALPHLCEALGSLHDRGLAHRALGPGTILMPRPGLLMLRDLGLAAAEPRVGERDDRYHAPEQAAGTTVPGPPADVHRLARILFELITGRPAGRRERQAAPSVLNPDIPPACDPVLRDALASDPTRRPGIGTFAADLRAALRNPRPARPPGQHRN